MSATTKKKHVTKEVLEEYPLPDEEHQVVKVTASRGNNLHEVVTSSDEKFLVSMPSKFRKHVWIKRGDFIMVEPIQEGDKVRGEISHILFKDQIKHIQDQGLWPDNFSSKVPEENKSMVPDNMLPPSDSDDSDNGLGDLVINMNRGRVTYVQTESEDESSEEDEEDGEDICDCNDEGKLQPDSSPTTQDDKDNINDLDNLHISASNEIENAAKEKG